MLDQLIIGEISSLDYDVSLATITVNPPKKKVIKETVPFSNKTYDFSAINGEVYWEEREIECVMEIIAPTPKELERKKTAFSTWVMNIQKENLINPFDPNYHYIATFEDIKYADEESVEKTTATVKFTAYPYKFSNFAKEYSFTILANSEITATILNDSSHRITPTLITTANITLTLDDTSYSIPIGEITDGALKMKMGVNTVTINNATETDCTLTVKFFEEVF